MDSDQWDREVLSAALRIIPMLNGMPINQAHRSLDITKSLLLQVHKVDAFNEELATFVKEFKDGLTEPI